MKKTIFLISLLFAIFICGITVYAEDGIKVMVDERTVEFDQPPVMMNNRTLVPVRAIFEKLGAEVEWDDVNQIVKAAKGDIKIELQIGNSYMNVEKSGDLKAVEIDQPPILLNSRTLVPVRAISEAFGAGVEWWSNTNTVAIDSDGIYESKKTYFHDGKLYFGMYRSTPSSKADKHKLLIWDGNETASINANGVPYGYIVKDGYIFYTANSHLHRVKYDGKEHRVLQKNIEFPYYSGPENKFFMKGSTIYYVNGYDGNVVLTSMNTNGGGVRELDIIEDYDGDVLEVFSNHGNIYVLFGEGSLNQDDVYEKTRLYQVSMDDLSVTMIKTYENTFTKYSSILGRDIPAYDNALNKDTLKVMNRYGNLGETREWRYFHENDRIYRENKEGEEEFVCSVYIKDDIVELFDAFIYTARQTGYYGWTETYTVEIMDLDGGNSQTIFFFDINSNTKINNTTDLSETGQAPQNCRVCGGAGTVECMTCGGSGQIRDYSFHVGSLADSSGDDRYRHCSFCAGGRKSCLACGGDGQIYD